MELKVILACWQESQIMKLTIIWQILYTKFWKCHQPDMIVFPTVQYDGIRHQGRTKARCNKICPITWCELYTELDVILSCWQENHVVKSSPRNASHTRSWARLSTISKQALLLLGVCLAWQTQDQLHIGQFLRGKKQFFLSFPVFYSRQHRIIIRINW